METPIALIKFDKQGSPCPCGKRRLCALWCDLCDKHKEHCEAYKASKKS